MNLTRLFISGSNSIGNSELIGTY